jgi:hypothetical protein
MIRIAFDTQHNSADPETPEAWRSEATGILRQIADRIDSGEPMPIRLHDSSGRYIGKARELSYQPEERQN